MADTKPVYATFDRATRTYTNPMVFASDTLATRAISSYLKVPENHGSLYVTHPEDYVLKRIGYYDEETSELINDEPETIVEYASLIYKLEDVENG